MLAAFMHTIYLKKFIFQIHNKALEKILVMFFFGKKNQGGRAGQRVVANL